MHFNSIKAMKDFSIFWKIILAIEILDNFASTFLELSLHEGKKKKNTFFIRKLIMNAIIMSKRKGNC